MDLSHEIAAILLEAGAVSINVAQPFTYASGIVSPIYCDNRLLISFPRERRRVVEGLVATLDSALGAPAVDVVAGTATGAIPWAAWVAADLDKPMIYVRGAAKEHGRGQRIEGRLAAGARVVVVEDLVTTGGSALSTVEAIREAGAIAVGCLAIFTYGLGSTERRFAEQGVALHALTSLPALLEVAVERGYLTAAEREPALAAIARAFQGRG